MIYFGSGPVVNSSPVNSYTALFLNLSKVYFKSTCVHHSSTCTHYPNVFFHLQSVRSIHPLGAVRRTRSVHFTVSLTKLVGVWRSTAAILSMTGTSGTQDTAVREAVSYLNQEQRETRTM